MTTSTSCVVIYFHLRAGASTSVELKHPAIGAWVTALRDLLTGSQVASPVGYPCLLEQDEQGKLLAVWSEDGVSRLAVPASAPTEPTAMQAAAALAFVNRHRRKEGVQPPLHFGRVSWTSPITPCDEWSDADIVAEAKRLGWCG